MKTATYLRWSLLIPFVVWGVCVLLILLVGTMPDSMINSETGDALTFGNAIGLFLIFYVIGIMIWIFPYLLLSLILFFWSFTAKAKVMVKVFALSPLAMTLLILAVFTLIDMRSADMTASFLNSGGFDRDWLQFNLMVVALTLAWGYICVGIGFGIYRLLQRRGKIQDEIKTETDNLSPVPGAA